LHTITQYNPHSMHIQKMFRGHSNKNIFQRCDIFGILRTFPGYACCVGINPRNFLSCTKSVTYQYFHTLTLDSNKSVRCC